MKNCSQIYLFIFIGIFTSCDKENAGSIDLQQSDVIGYWEANDNSIQFMLGNYYCNSFELRNNSEFAIYYADQEKPSNSRVDGIWSIADGNDIVFNHTSSVAVSVKVTGFSETEMKIKEDDNVDFTIVLNKN